MRGIHDGQGGNRQHLGVGDHTCAAWSDGTAWCWRRNGSGQLGNWEERSKAQTTPVPVTGLACVEGVGAGNSTACAWRRDGKALCWGDNLFGSLGSGTIGGPTPTEVTGLDTVVFLSTMGFGGGALLDGGTITRWGGLADQGENSALPLLVEMPPARQLTVGYLHTCATVDGSVWCWGKNWYGGLGDGTTDDRYTPAPVAGIQNAVGLALGYGFSCALIEGGTAKCWGANDFGQLLVEVTSRSTEKKDRGVKLEDYLQIEALEEYLIVSHSRRELELWSRAADGWSRSLVTNGSLELRSGATIDVDSLYADLPD